MTAGLVLVGALGLLIVVMVGLVVTAVRTFDPDPVVNVAACTSCGQPTFQPIAADEAREPVLCTACSPVQEAD